MSPKLFPPPPLLFYKYFIRTCTHRTQTRGDNTEKLLYKKLLKLKYYLHFVAPESLVFLYALPNI